METLAVFLKTARFLACTALFLMLRLIFQQNTLLCFVERGVSLSWKAGELGMAQVEAILGLKAVGLRSRIDLIAAALDDSFSILL